MLPAITTLFINNPYCVGCYDSCVGYNRVDFTFMFCKRFKLGANCGQVRKDKNTKENKKAFILIGLLRLDKEWPARTFCEFVTLESGAILAQNIVYTVIETSILANASNHYNFIGNFLGTNCSHLFGKETIVYFKVSCNARSLEYHSSPSLFFFL